MQTPVSDRTIDTAPLQRVIDMFAAMSAAILEGVLDKAALAGLKKCTSEIERVSKELRRTSLANMKASALARLRSDRAYRARVCGELGGHHVIARWRERLRASNFPRQIELRRERAENLLRRQTDPDAPFKRASEAAVIDKNPARPPRQKRPVKTDRAGLFRLAPVPIWLDANTVSPPLSNGAGAGEGRRGPRRAAHSLLKPIPLMPFDIGPDNFGQDDFLESPPSDFIAPADIPIEGIPIEDGPDPFSNSQRITAEERKHWQWNAHCQEYFPPLEPETHFEPEPDPPPRGAAPFVRRL